MTVPQHSKPEKAPSRPAIERNADGVGEGTERTTQEHTEALRPLDGPKHLVPPDKTECVGMRETATDQEVGVAPLLRTTEDENRPVLRDDRGRWLPGTRPGPGRHPMVAVRDRMSKALAKHAHTEHAILAYDTLVTHMKRGSLRAAIEYLRVFGGMVDQQALGAHVNATAIKVVVNVDEGQL